MTDQATYDATGEELRQFIERIGHLEAEGGKQSTIGLLINLSRNASTV